MERLVSVCVKSIVRSARAREKSNISAIISLYAIILPHLIILLSDPSSWEVNDRRSERALEFPPLSLRSARLLVKFLSQSEQMDSSENGEGEQNPLKCVDLDARLLIQTVCCSPLLQI